MIICLRTTGDFRFDGKRMKRIQSLKKIFERDNHLPSSQYRCFMDELIDKEYARKCDCAGPKERTCYVLHHEVLNPKKGKIRVVSDCSFKYKGNSLLSGPDLTNQLIGVLQRCRL